MSGPVGWFGLVGWLVWLVGWFGWFGWFGLVGGWFGFTCIETFSEGKVSLLLGLRCPGVPPVVRNPGTSGRPAARAAASRR